LPFLLLLLLLLLLGVVAVLLLLLSLLLAGCCGVSTTGGWRTPVAAAGVAACNGSGAAAPATPAAPAAPAVAAAAALACSCCCRLRCARLRRQAGVPGCTPPPADHTNIWRCLLRWPWLSTAPTCDAVGGSRRLGAALA
jgi:hypothetical protein